MGRAVVFMLFYAIDCTIGLRIFVFMRIFCCSNMGRAVVFMLFYAIDCTIGLQIFVFMRIF